MSILNHDLLILQQFRSDSSPRFDILDAQGQGVGVVSGTESGVRRGASASVSLSGIKQSN